MSRQEQMLFAVFSGILAGLVIGPLFTLLLIG
jgi:tetrahydromethanopterin S-methyltransferase subunit F